MDIEPLSLPDVLLLRARRFGDARGWFSETYNAESFSRAGIRDVFVQDNHSLSRPRLTVRGLHFQVPPHAQAKLIRVVRGAVFDVAVDLRRDAPTFGRWCGATLTAEGGEQLYVPVGFAHGFCTLEPDTEVCYKVSGLYAPDCDAGVRWDDPAIGVDWPLGGAAPVLSDKDRALPLLADFASPFRVGASA